MFARWARLPLRRCLHTRVPVQKTPFNRIALALGVSTAAATYVTWRLAANDYRIALDSPQTGKVSGSKSTSGTTSLSQEEAAPAPPSEEGPSSSTSSPPSPPPPSSTKGIKGDQTNEPSDKTTTSQEEGQEDNNNDASESNGSNGGAFNPETGEINWDCPCLGGMAHGPCGPEFREAFSCFVFSEAEPKGMDCVEKFKAMQDCFRAHPDVYADEIADDEEENVPASQGVEEKGLPIQPQQEIPPDNTPGSPTSTTS